MGSIRGNTLLPLAGVASIAGLAATLPPPVASVMVLRHPQSVIDTHGVDAVALAATGLACWASLGWLALAVVATVAAGAPGRLGRYAGYSLALTVPASVRRLIAICLGVTLATATAPTGALASTTPQRRDATTVATVDLDWPIAPAPAPERYLVANPQRRVVVVRPGDSLWAIAQRHLPPRASAQQIAVAWPRWYAANRALIGPNPDLLLPGQRLTPPLDTPPLDTPPVNSPGGSP